MHGVEHLKKDALFIVISTRNCVSQNAEFISLVAGGTSSYHWALDG